MTSQTESHVQASRRVELWLMVGILVVAAFLRFHAADRVPPGPSHDELRMMQLGELIVQGERPIHWKISYSAEPLYMYLLAVAMPVWGFTPFGARLVTRFAGLLLIPVAYRLARLLLGRRAALFASGVLAVTWWPLLFSRVALRGITLSIAFAAGVICLWRGLGLCDVGNRRAGQRLHWGWLTGSGVLFGLSWYTFTAARGMVVLLPMALAHMGLLGVIPAGRLWRVALVTVGVAALVVAPFAYELWVHPGVPESRLGQLSGVIDDVLAGNFVLLARQAVSAIAVFGVKGDPNWRYNVSGRAPFGPVLGALSLLGLVHSVLRWRQPRYALLVMWLGLGLAPSVLTPEAPSFVRGIGAMPVAAAFPAIGAVFCWDRVRLGSGRRVDGVVAALLSLVILCNGLATFRDVFSVWPEQPQVREIYQASLTEAFRDINHSNLEGTLWVSEPFPDDRHIMLAERVLGREAVEPRWFDAGRSLILPPADGTRRYLFADFVEPDGRLMERWMSEATKIMEGRSSPSRAPAYCLYEVRGGQWVADRLSAITRQSEASLDLAGDEPVALPARFAELAEFVGYELAAKKWGVGDEVRLTAYWRVEGPTFEPLASFAHLVDEQQTIVGQYDGFDVPPWHWEPGSVVAQVYRFPVDPSARSGTYWLQVGLYDAQTMERVQVMDRMGSSLGNRLVLGAGTVKQR